MSAQNITALVRTAYVLEVGLRGAQANMDYDTQQHIAKVSSWLTSDTMKPSLLIFGGVGNGKSTILMALKKGIEEAGKSAGEYIRANNPLFYGNSALNSHLEKIRDFARLKIVTAQEVARLASNDHEEFMKIVNTSFLAIDDLGCEPSTVKNYGTEVTPVVELIYQRYDKMLPTVITTNLDREDIKKRYGERVNDRFNEMFECLAFTNGSYRK